MNKTLKLIISLVIPLTAGFVGSFFTTASINSWYVHLDKPFLNPPNWIFAPVWTGLYLMMGLALFFIWTKGFENKNVKIAVFVFFIQLVLNSIWSILFFGLQNPFLALIEIILLWIFIIITIYLFYKIYKPSAYLLIPYILWVSFAIYLNYSIWILN